MNNSNLMIFDNDNDSFYNYLIENGFLFDYRIIENFLLSLKSNPFVVLIGNEGCGKSSLPILFSKYLSKFGKKEDIILNSVNSLGKSYSNKEWHLKRSVIEEILPILPFEGKDCIFTINDSFTSYGYFKIDPRFKFRDKRLINYLFELQEENPDQDLNLKIKVGEKYTDARYFKLNDLKNDISCLEDFILDKDAPIHKFLNNSKLHLDINYYIIVDDIDETIGDDFLKFINYVNDEFLVDRNTNNLFIIGTIDTGNFNQISDSLIDRVSFIELDDLNMEKCLLNDFEKFPELKDVNYLEFTNDDVLTLSIKDFKSIFSEIWCEGSDLWSLISLELNLINKILSKEGFIISFRMIKDIFRFMLVSWRYEGKPFNWENWEKYFDIQFKQKILSKIGKAPSSSKFFKELLNICLKSENNSFDENNIKYENTILKIRNMENCLNNDNFSFFNCTNSIINIAEAKNNLNNNKTSKKSIENVGSKYGSNIYKYGEFFTITKQINRKTVNFGKFNNLDDAKFVKNLLVENNWKLSRIRNNDIYQNGDLYWVIKVLNNKINILGKFYSYQQAKEHVEWLVSKFKTDENFEVYVPKKENNEEFNKENYLKTVSNISGWEKLVFNTINELDTNVFSLDDLKELDTFEMYKFEDESLESIIKENLYKLANLKLIRVMGNDYYKKVC